MLLHVPDVLTREQLGRFRAALELAQWADGRQTVGTLGAQVKRNQQLPEGSPLKAELGKVVLAALERSALFFAAALPLKILPPRFNRYAGGAEYGFHIDGAVMHMGAGAQLRSDLSCTLFLNEPGEYEGGELVVSDTYGEHEIKLPAGDLILYPAGSRHKVTPVVRGQRLAAFFWVQSMVRDDARRRLLFEMDAAIETLRRGRADAGAVLQLTGIYHNLLRDWSEV